ncbi:MAG: bifunctional serine/threonine-protein kinase/formylglycine-generating enzyme family protein [Planctomycetota bacterium]
MSTIGLGPADDEARMLGPFRLLERVGEGGMGTVWLAERREPVHQRVALKVIRTDRLEKTYRARFAMEQQALARMDHPNIARLFDAGEADGQSWYAMEYVPGQTLADHCRDRRLAVEDRLRLFVQICDGVQHAHQRGILHRDLKPQNVLVREIDGRPVAKIVDFGLAQPVDPLQIRATLHEAAHSIVGTLAYMSPEQADRVDGDLDVRTDVYSLGVVLYELLTGELPIGLDELRRHGMLQVGAILREHTPPKPSTRLSQLGEQLAVAAAERSAVASRLCARVRGDLDLVTMRAIEPDRRRRYESVRDFARDVERVLQHRPVEARAPSAGYLLRKWVRRHWRGVAVGGGVLAAGAVFAGVSYTLREAARVAEERQRLVAKGIYVGNLLRQADEELWPAAESEVPAMTAWLRQTADMESLAADLQEYRAWLGMSMRDSSTESVAFAESQLRSVATGIAAAERLPAARARVEARRDLASSLARRTVGAFAAAWQRAKQEVATDARFAGFQLPDVPGLVPLGRNPESGLQEFYLLDSGVGPVPHCRKDGTYEIGADTGLIFVLVPGGEFSAEQQGGVPYCGHRALLPFLISRYEMSQAQWARMMTENASDDAILAAANPSTQFSFAQNEAGPEGVRTAIADPAAKGRWRHPVQSVSWLEATRRLPRLGLALPTQAQWMWAANGKPEAELHFAWFQELDGAAVNFMDDFFRACDRGDDLPGGPPSATYDGYAYTCPVDALRPNAFGLHNVFGNVAELVRDGYEDDPPERVDGPEQLSCDAARIGLAMWLGGSCAMDRRRPSSHVMHQIPIGNVEATTGLRPILPLTYQ